ncbi:MAG: site-2 protease family protein [Nocardioidaceae bacterium]
MEPPRQPSPRAPGTWRIGQIGGIDVLVRSSWLLVAVLISVTLSDRIDQVAPGLGSLKYVAGLAFAVLLYLSVLLHELSHALVAKRFGMKVSSVTLHFLGGVTEIEGEAESARNEFWISVVGPLTSLAVGAAALVATYAMPGGLLLFTCQALAGANIVVGALNLVPGLPLDGGRVLRAAVWAISGRPLMATQVAGWAGRVVAVAALAYPLMLSHVVGISPNIMDFFLAGVIALFLWAGASQALVSARLRKKMPSIVARALARRALAVPSETPLGEALRRARDAAAGGLVVLDVDGQPSGLVNEQAVLATPEARRPWLSAGSVARRLEPGLTLPADLTGEALISAMQRNPASEYLLVELDGSVFGVLVTSDVDQAFVGQ